MKIKNNYLLGMCVIFIISIISGCRVSDNDKNYNEKNIYNDNEVIAQTVESHTFRTYGSTKNSNNGIDLKYGGFSGVDTIWILKAEDDGEITLDYDSNVDSGDFKTVLVKQDKEIENILEGTDQGSKTIKLTKGEYRFRLVGNNAKGKVKFMITQNKKC